MKFGEEYHEISQKVLKERERYSQAL